MEICFSDTLDPLAWKCQVSCWNKFFFCLHAKTRQHLNTLDVLWTKIKGGRMYHHACPEKKAAFSWKRDGFPCFTGSIHSSENSLFKFVFKSITLRHKVCSNYLPGRWGSSSSRRPRSQEKTRARMHSQWTEMFSLSAVSSNINILLLVGSSYFSPSYPKIIQSPSPPCQGEL